MDKAYSKGNKKDRFITDHLLPYLLKYIEENMNSNVIDEIIERVACMCIFPYKTSDGVRIGSLKESGISWYYVSENDKSRVSSGSYRVFADDTMKKEQIIKFRQIFLSCGLITEFSDAAVVKDLILRMSKEHDYTEVWWTCAYDVFRLWKPGELDSEINKATQSMNNNCFLFDRNYNGYVLKDDLIKEGIFRDIITPTSMELFWNKVPKERKQDAIAVLKKMGVPSTFVYRQEEWSYIGMRYAEHINPYILRYVEGIGENVRFPIGNHEKDSERCRISHSIFMDIIWKESKDAFWDATSNTERSYNKGILVKNIDDCYVPISWHLFYSKEDLDEVKAFNDNKYDHKETEINDSRDSDLEYLHIDVSLYDKDFINGSDKIHEFSEVCETADEYDIEEDDTEIFYKWIWSYSKHTGLAHNILYYYSGDAKDRITLEKSANDFVLSVIKSYDAEDDSFAFDIDLLDSEAFSHSDTINKICTCFKEIYVVVYSEYSRIDVSDYLKRILTVTDASYTVKSKIKSSEIWEHVYLAAGNNNNYDGVFIKCKIFEDGYEDAIVLWPSVDEDSYVRALAGYVRSQFDVEVAIGDALSFNWKEEYLNLAKGIRGFISEKTDKKLPEDLYGYIAEMEDVEDFGTEKRIWMGLKDQRDRIIVHETSSSPVDLSSWREFLSSRYTGRCQLCGGKIITGKQNAHFFTYRLVKPSSNYLADMNSNMFCLCPSCWGEMEQGNFMGKDMSELLTRALEYAEYIEKKIEADDMEDHFPSLVREVWETQLLTEEDEENLEGFHNPIVCHVMVNGKDRSMAFSWQHFMRVAFILSETEEVKE